MMPLVWRLGAGLGGLGAIVIAPYLAGACILAVLGLPLTSLRFGLAYAYWQALDLPAFAAYAARIRWAGGFGLALAPAAWGYGVTRLWRLVARTVPAAVRPPALPRASGLAGRRCGLAGTTGPDHTPATPLSPAPGRIAAAGRTDLWRHPRGAEECAVRDNLRAPLLVIDLDGAMHDATAGWRAAFGDVHRLALLGGGRPWNPLAIAWTDWGLDRSALDALAAYWYPRAGSHRPRARQPRARHVPHAW